MPRTPGWTCIVAAVALTCASVASGQQQVYRYTDSSGRVIYSDRQPPADAKDVQPKRLGANFIESDPLPLATRQVSDRFPVTLYTFDCGEFCQNAEALLNRRGVPFSTVDVQQPDGFAKLKALTGEQTAPVLQVGDKLIAKGFSESRWNQMLDDAGYPKSPGYKRPAAAPKTADIAPRAPTSTVQSVSATAPRGGDYPK
ncbi:MAG TPA: glutaredoxin family protein [Casimicrobiaceae bacterium]|nr:glutaredoxin family protein [Casimicrobiaceae bacterium]